MGQKVEINNSRKVGIGDEVLCYTEDKSFNWNNGFKIVKGFKNGLVKAVDKNSKHQEEGTYYNTSILY